MKLHNNPLSHQNTPADYIISFMLDGRLRLCLVECKQVTCKEEKGRLAFKRLKQLHDLLSFEKNQYHYSFLCIAFYDERWSRSEVYLIRAKDLAKQITDINKVSMNREEFKKLFKYDNEVNLWKMQELILEN